MFFKGLPSVGGYLEPELTPELVYQGWRKFWSKRENRPYFWNRLTGESLWEMPVLKQHVSSFHLLKLVVQILIEINRVNKFHT